MKWLTAMTMATQIASAAVGVTANAQAAPALTPQQKQELSTYNFKGAETALEAQANQPDAEARRAHPDSSAEGSADHKPRLLGSALTCGRFGG